MNGNRDGGERIIASVETATRLIEALYESSGAGITELAEQFDLSKGAVHHQLGTLRKQGFVVKEGTQYHPSLRFLNIGQGIKHQSEVFEAAKPELLKLADRSGEYAHLMVEQNGWGYILHKERGENANATVSRSGKRLHLHYTSTGKAILAHLPEERVKRIVDERGLPERTDDTITDREALFEELAEIREQGVAFDRGEQISNARCVGAPVLGPDGDVLGAISVSGPRGRINGEWFESELPDVVGSAADVIEMNIEMNELASRSF